MFDVKELTDDEFDYFRHTIYKESGINLTDLKRALVQSRLIRRLRALQLSSFHEYQSYLKNNYDEEIDNFINVITTNKTDFFRENKHFEYMKNVIFPEFEKLNKKKIRIWSAGCSTGEEPYSIAITCQEYYKDRKDIDCKILATDIDTNVVDFASNGIYKNETVNVIDEKLLKKYFLKGTGENSGKYKTKPILQDMIVFKKLNLLDDVFPMKGKFDIIFCRNVIIYFDRDTQSKLFEKFSRYISDNGYLFIGHSENLTGVSVKFKNIGHTIYKKCNLETVVYD